MFLAEQLISRQVVTAFPEQRLVYLSERILECNAQYCAVLKPKTYVLLGLIRFFEVVANPATATRIFTDLMGPPPPVQVYDSDPVERVIELLAAHHPLEIAVIEQTGEFVGLITPESMSQWILGSGHSLEKILAKLPLESRWNPYAPPPRESKRDAG